jgi:hypothetical protein
MLPVPRNVNAKGDGGKALVIGHFAAKFCGVGCIGAVSLAKPSSPQRNFFKQYLGR